jgi:hypothetical protein
VADKNTAASTSAIDKAAADGISEKKYPFRIPVNSSSATRRNLIPKPAAPPIVSVEFMLLI